MASYSLDLRERIVKAHVEEGQNKSAVARRFGVSRWSVDRYVRRSAAGSLAATPHPGSRQRLNGAQCEVLREQVARHKDWTLERHAEALAKKTGVEIKKSSVGNYLKRLGITHKKRASLPVSETNKNGKATSKRVEPKDAKTLVFIDETSAYVGQSREYGWAASNERVHDSRPKGKKKRVSLIAAASLGGAMAEQALVVTDTVNKNAFLAFLGSTLLPTLAKGSVLVMDNWRVHHGDDVRDLVDACGCELFYLPTYSPDFNPIEHLFAKVKAFIKRLRPDTTDKLTQAFCDAVKTVTPQNVLNAFKHCGYGLEQ